MAADFRAKLFESFDGVFEHGRLDFHLDFQFVHRLRAGDDQLIVRLDAFDGEQNAFDLRREEVDTTDDKHVVATAADLLHADERTAAGALFIAETRDVVRAVAEKRHTGLRDRRQRQFAFFSGRQDFACVRIEDFRIVVVFEDMEAIVGFAVHGDARTHDFGKTEHVMRLDTSLLLDEIAHAFGPRLRAENAEAELRVMEIETDLVGFFNQMDEEGRRAADDGRAEIADEHQLLFRGAAAHRNDRRAEAFSAVVRAKTAREEAVTITYLNDIVFRRTAADEGAGHGFSPDVDILFRIADDSRLAGRSAGGMDTDDVLLRDGEEAEGIVVAKIGLDGRRKLCKIRERDEIARLDTFLVKGLVIERDILIESCDGVLQAGQLDLFEGFAIHEIL